MEKEYHFTGFTFMEESYTNYDYGLLTTPTFTTFGTEDYATIPQPVPGDELWLSEAVCDYVADDLIANNYMYYTTGYYQDAWGTLTTSNTVNWFAGWHEQNAVYSAVFYKGHIAFLSNFGYTCDLYPNCPLAISHYGLYPRYEPSPSWPPIQDYLIDDAVDAGKATAGRSFGSHDFVFNWACDLGGEPKIGDWEEAHSSSILPCWMDTDPYCLNVGTYPPHDGYLNPDYSDHVYISFEGPSMWFDMFAQDYNYDYATFCAYIYYFLMQGTTVQQALNFASTIVNDCPYDYSDIGYNGIPINVDGVYYTGRLRVWGDGYHKLPH